MPAPCRMAAPPSAAGTGETRVARTAPDCQGSNMRRRPKKASASEHRAAHPRTGVPIWPGTLPSIETEACVLRCRVESVPLNQDDIDVIPLPLAVTEARGARTEVPEWAK